MDKWNWRQVKALDWALCAVIIGFTVWAIFFK